MLLATLAMTAAFAAQDTSRVIEVPDSGRIVRIGAFRPRQYLGDESFPGGVTPPTGATRSAPSAAPMVRTRRAARTSGTGSACA